jgi:hypothetical protein
MMKSNKKKTDPKNEKQPWFRVVFLIPTPSIPQSETAFLPSFPNVVSG